MQRCHDDEWYLMYAENNRFITCACVALVVSMVTEPLDIETLCDNGGALENISVVGSDPESINGNGHSSSAVWNNYDKST